MLRVDFLGLVGMDNAQWTRYCKDTDFGDWSSDWTYDPSKADSYPTVAAMIGDQDTSFDGKSCAKANLDKPNWNYNGDSGIRLCGRFYPRGRADGTEYTDAEVLECVRNNNCEVVPEDSPFICGNWWQWADGTVPTQCDVGTDACSGALFTTYEYNSFCEYTQNAGSGTHLAAFNAAVAGVNADSGIYQMSNANGNLTKLGASFPTNYIGLPYCQQFEANPTDASMLARIQADIWQMPAATWPDDEDGQTRADSGWKGGVHIFTN